MADTPNTRIIEIQKVVQAQNKAESKMLEAQYNENPDDLNYYRGLKVAMESVYLGMFDLKVVLDDE